jgi:superfamily II DNA helicase RecQ
LNANNNEAFQAEGKKGYYFMVNEKDKQILTRAANGLDIDHEAVDDIMAPDRKIKQLKYKKSKMALQAQVDLDECAQRLFDKLREWRNQVAHAEQSPAFCILQDAALLGIACKRPKTKYELLQVYKVGDKKLDQYGDEILKIVREHEESEKGPIMKVVEPKKYILVKKGMR